MNQAKNELLTDTQNRAVSIGFGLEPIGNLTDVFAHKLMIIGTAADEKYTSLAGLRTLIENQQAQTKGMEVRFARSEVYRDFSADENIAIIVEDITAFITVNTDSTQFDLRSSAVLEFINGQWKVIHWHASKPDPVESEVDTFGIDEWKQKAGELEKLVAERTADLVAKNQELSIEAALERVRAQTMAMHNSEDIGKCIVKMFNEVTALGVDEGTRFGIGILNHDNENNQLWTASKDGEEVNMHIGHLEMTWHPLLKSARRAWKEQVSLHRYVLEGEDLLNYYQMLNNAPDYKYRIDLEKLPEREFHYGFVFDHGFFYAFSPREFQPDLIHIVQRFSSLFGQTYRRYLDLINAEAQTRESQVELSLEKVRSRSMAMYQSHELAEAASVLFRQIRELGYEMWSCGFCIWKPDDFSELWMSADAGGLLPPMLMPYKKDPTHRKIYEASRRQEPVHEYVWEGEELAEHYEFLNTIPSAKEAIGILKKSGLSLPSKQCYYVGFFKQGYLLIITKEPVPEMHELTYRFTRVFEQTYTRFLDLQKAEQLTEQTKLDLIQIQTEKQRAENALAELKATQAQLIQAEKMASLGELMAGIAHEIQNPLNFVNNFAEVSAELVAELEEEQQKPSRDPDLETNMLADVQQNLQKITHHGQRASAIVRAMLEHSRTSTGQPEPTNLNKLADEYLPLAYQGVRAKDKLFSCEISTDFDTNLGLVNLVAQDMGRVLLNLYNNAFYAVSQHRQTAPADYRPRIRVSTQRIGSGIDIRVSDNGTGMAESVKAKIFQPFFTTKPTGQGTGLGLSLSYDIVKAHGGTIRVESTVGDGSVFTITLPQPVY